MLAQPKNPSNGMPPDATLKPEDIHPTKLRIYKNLVILSISFWMLFSAYDGLVMLQSTLNSDKGIGVISVSVQYACGCLSAVLFPKYFIRKLGCKMAIIACIMSHVPYIASNFYPHWILMIPSSILLGAANPLVWAAACAYLNNLSKLYSKHIESDESLSDRKCDTNNSSMRPNISEIRYGSVSNGTVIENGLHSLERRNNFSENETCQGVNSQNLRASKILENTIACFFGFHGTVYTMNIATSNILSYYILRIGIVEDRNVTNSSCSCGAGFCNNQVECFDSNLKPPIDEIRYILIGAFVCLVVLSAFIVVVLLDDLDKSRKSVSLSLELLMATFKLMKQSKMFLLIPVTFYIGIAQGFFMGDYTQAYVGCAWGIQNVGLVTATFGLALALFSISSGWFVKYIGRPPIFLFAAALNVATIAILLLWFPDGERPAMMFVVSAFFGIFISLYWTQVRAFIGIIFKTDQEAAFGNYQLWHSVGVSIAFGYSKYVCTSIKIYILLAISTFGILGYLLVERSYLKCVKETKKALN